MTKELIHVIAEVRLLSTAEGGKTNSISGSYRPNHNFFDDTNTKMTIGALEIPAGIRVQPGETIILPITFFWWPELSGQIYPGREWRIQEGPKIVGIGIVKEVLGNSPSALQD